MEDFIDGLKVRSRSFLSFSNGFNKQSHKLLFVKKALHKPELGFHEVNLGFHKLSRKVLVTTPTFVKKQFDIRKFHRLLVCLLAI